MAICKNYFNGRPRLSITFVFIISKVKYITSKNKFNLKCLEIKERFGCLSQLNQTVSQQCLKTCTSHHNAVSSLMQNFKHLALNGDSTQAERYLAESCE